MNSFVYTLMKWALILCLSFTVGCGGAEKPVDTPDQGEEIILAAQKQTTKGFVHLTKEEGRFSLVRDGVPYYIKGIAGRENIEIARALGANSIRTWYTAEIDSLLDKADSLGMTVLVGLEIGRQRQGFDYGDVEKLAEQEEEILEIVAQYKSHPAILGWIVGNEPDLLAADDTRIWKAIYSIIDKIHREDPEHPVTICSRPEAISLKNIKTYCPNIDFLTVNVFNKIHGFPTLLAKATDNWDIPYVFGEWGALGYWQAEYTDWYAPIELTTTEKVEKIRSYQKLIAQEEDQCLGSYAFYWGQKQERTHTWFSLFMESGEKTAMIDALADFWGGEYTNAAPLIKQISIVGKQEPKHLYLSSREEYKAKALFHDPDSDSLHIFWEILPEGNYVDKVGGDKELRPLGVPYLIENPREESLVFQAPEQEGAYRLFLYCYDKKGNAASSNLPFYVSDQSLK